MDNFKLRKYCRFLACGSRSNKSASLLQEKSTGVMLAEFWPGEELQIPLILSA